jgi:hypothetical protein
MSWITPDPHGDQFFQSSRCTIENTGNKLAPTEIPAAFDRFWRGDASRSQTGDHFGLGLPLAKKLLAVLGGQIDVIVSDDLFRVHIVISQPVTLYLSRSRWTICRHIYNVHTEIIPVNATIWRQAFSGASATNS